MDVDGNEGLILDPLHLGEVVCSLVNQLVEHVQESLVGRWHDLLVGTRQG